MPAMGAAEGFFSSKVPPCDMSSTGFGFGAVKTNMTTVRDPKINSSPSPRTTGEPRSRV